MLCSKDERLKVNSEETLNKKSPENKLETHLHGFNRRHVLTKTKFALLSQSIKEKKQVIQKKYALISQSLNEKNRLMPMSERQQRVLARIKAWKKNCLSVTDSIVESEELKARVMKIASESRQASKICVLRDILKKKIQYARLKVQKEQEAKKILKDRLVQCARIKSSKEQEAKKIIQDRLVLCARTKASKEHEAKKIIQDRLVQCARTKASKEQEAKKIIKDRLVQCARIKASKEQEAKKIIKDRLVKYAIIKEQKEREAKKINLSKSMKDRVKINDMENDSSSLKVSEEQPCSSKITQPTMLLINNTKQFLFIRLPPYQKESYELIPVEKIKDMNNASQPSQLPAVKVNAEPLDSGTSCQTLHPPSTLELVFEQEPEKDLLTYIKEEIMPLLTCTQENEQFHPVKVKVEPMEGE